MKLPKLLEGPRTEVTLWKWVRDPLSLLHAILMALAVSAGKAGAWWLTAVAVLVAVANLVIQGVTWDAYWTDRR